MTGSLIVVCAATLLTSLSSPAETGPVAATKSSVAQDAVIPIESVAVENGVVVLTSPHGATTIPDGTFLGPRGSSVKVLRGRITAYAPPGVGEAGVDDRGVAPEPLLTVSGAHVEAGRVWLVTASGRETRLADGVYASGDGAAVFVEDGRIAGLRTG